MTDLYLIVIYNFLLFNCSLLLLRNILTEKFYATIVSLFHTIKRVKDNTVHFWVN
jgi:hypothetical protein